MTHEGIAHPQELNIRPIPNPSYSPSQLPQFIYFEHDCHVVLSVPLGSSGELFCVPSQYKLTVPLLVQINSIPV